eukprot:gene23354-biopygen8574
MSPGGCQRDRAGIEDGIINVPLYNLSSSNWAALRLKGLEGGPSSNTGEDAMASLAVCTCVMKLCSTFYSSHCSGPPCTFIFIPLGWTESCKHQS